MQILPVNIAGVLLILLALALFILEAKYTSHGVLLAGGVVSMLLGAMFLIRSPLTAGGVTPGGALPGPPPFSALTVFFVRPFFRSPSPKTTTRPEKKINSPRKAV